jgi:hypothetical protein
MEPVETKQRLDFDEKTGKPSQSQAIAIFDL